MFICGGEANSSDLQDFWVFDLELCGWIQLEITGQVAFHAKRFHSCCSVSQNRVITFGGCHSEYVHLNDLNIFYLDDFVSSNGTNKLVNCVKVNFDKTAICPSSRWGHTGSVYQDKMYILGGRNENDISDLFVFDPETLKWSVIIISGRIPTPRRRHSAVFIASSLVMFGGFDGAFFNDLYALHLNDQRKNLIQVEKSKIDRDFTSLINNPAKSDLRLKICFSHQE